MKKLILILALTVTAAAQAQNFSGSSWSMVGTTVGSNYAYAVMPKLHTLSSLQYFCQHSNALLTMLWPTGAVRATSITDAAQSDVTAASALGFILEGTPLIIWSASNNAYQVAICLSNAADGVITISNKSNGGGAATLTYPVQSNDYIYACATYPMGKIPIEQTLQPTLGILTGNPLVAGQRGWPVAFELYLASGSLSNIYVNGFGSR